MTSFWPTLPRPFFVLAPMANVTDSVFRKVIVKYGKPDVVWTEFVSADGLCSPKGREALVRDLVFSKKERPIVAQLFTGHPDAMRQAAKLCAELGFDGVDINMGCPDRAVEKQGGGAAHIRNPKVAVEVIEAARQGIKDAGKDIPVSVKTRIGYNKVEYDWLRTILALKVPALTVHLRTRKEMSDVPAHWELMPDIVKMRDEIQADVPSEMRTLIIGNGDVVSLNDALAKTKETGCDGVMIGRGIFGTPWFFENLAELKGRGHAISSISTFNEKLIKTQKSSPDIDPTPKTPAERLKILVEHAKLFEKTFKGFKNFAVMKKHFKAYVSGWDGAKELRVELMGVENSKQVGEIVKRYMKGLKVLDR